MVRLAVDDEAKAGLSKRGGGTSDEKGGTAENSTSAPCRGGGFYFYCDVLLFSELLAQGARGVYFHWNKT